MRFLLAVWLVLAPLTLMAPLTSMAKAGLYSRSLPLMGTEFVVLVWTEDGPGATAALDAAMDEVRRLEQLLSEWRADSEISTLNRLSGQAVSVSPETLEVLADAVEVARLSGGAFDPTWAALWGLWDFKRKPFIVPAASDVRRAVSRVDYTALKLDRASGTAQLQRPGMAVGLGGIGKGYAVDRIVAVLAARGFHDCLVDGGGDTRASGSKGDRAWRIGIRAPRHSGLAATLEMGNEALATSGDYERFVMVDGVRYHHILDPRTGQPTSGMASVSVLAKSAARADALATAAFVLGMAEGTALLGRLSGVEGVLISAGGDVVVTSGLKRRLKTVGEAK